MPDSVVPDPEFQPAADLAEKRAERTVDQYVGIAEREAAAIMATMDVGSPAGLHNSLVVAFLKGWVAGYGVVTEHMDAILDRYEQGLRL